MAALRPLTTYSLTLIILNIRSAKMATESFSRTFEVNTDWGVKNLEKAIDEGSVSVRRVKTPEYQKKFKEMTTLTEEDWAKIKEKYGAK